MIDPTNPGLRRSAPIQGNTTTAEPVPTSVGHSAPASEETDTWLLAFNQDNLERIIGFVRLADRKAQFLLTITLAIFAGGSTLLPEATRLASNSMVLASVHWAVPVLLPGVYLVFLVTVVLAVWTFVGIVRPRLVPATGHGSPLFFQTIATMDPSAFKETMKSIPRERAIDELAEQSYNVSVIARSKFEEIERGVRRLTVAGLSGILFTILINVLRGLT